MSKDWILCDLDGTLCDHRHRLAYAHSKDWDNYNGLSGADRPVEPVLDVLQTFAEVGKKVGIITARPDNVRDITQGWLDRHEVPCHWLVMRKYGDLRSDHIVKLEAALYRWLPVDVLFVLDDRDGVVSAWRNNGYTCFQVAEDEMPKGWTP